MLSSDPFIRNLAQAFSVANQSHQFLGFPKGTVRGTIVDVDDPKERGRVKVIFDDVNPNLPQQTGSGKYSDKRVGEEPDQSHWIDASPAFKGKQPKGLLGKRVNISVSNGQYQFAVLQNVMFDPQILATSEKDKLKMPNNSTMTRMPIYEKGTLPPPCEENWGCSVIEQGGPYSDDWLCVCLKRSGRYLWVRHIDMQHAHAGANDTTAFSDTGGNRPFPGKAVTGWDFVVPTSAREMIKFSVYGTKPTGNPKGESCQWFPSPMSDDEPLPTVPPFVTNQDEALVMWRDLSGFTDNIAGGLVPISGIKIPILSDILPFLGFDLDINKMLQSAIDAAKERALKELSNATGGISDQVIQATNITI